MPDLIYPQGSVRILGRQKATGLVEILPAVEENGLVYGSASRKYCHENGILHPVVHLHIVDRFSRLCLQKRSDGKEVCPSMWDTAVGGHVGFGEYALEALSREAQEELGLSDFNPHLIDDYIWENGRDRELVFVFAIVGSYHLSPDRDEVSEVKNWEMEEIEKMMGKGVFTPQFEQEFPRIKNKLLSLL